MSKIQLQQISKQFGETQVLKAVNLDIDDGEFLTLVGPSGCGKSTLLRIIAGLEMQTSGNVLIGDSLMNTVRASNRDLAMVFQSYALYPHLTVRQNMATPLLLRDLTLWQRLPLLGRLASGHRSAMALINSLVDDTAATLKINHLLDRKPGQLSGGQRQRAALGRAMVRQPVAFLMDEPLSNLDAALRVHMRAELAELHQKLKTTFVYVTHDQAEALTMSDRMAVMMDGHILQLGPPAEVYGNPLDRRVAEFVGSPKINLFSAEVDSAGRVMSAGVPFRRRLSVLKNTAGLSVGLRPEHLQISTCAVEGESWPLRIVYKENLGSDFFLHGTINGSSDRVVVRAAPSMVSEISIGDDVFVQAEEGAAMAFGQDLRRLAFAEGQ